jgi:glycerate kinase
VLDARPDADVAVVPVADGGEGTVAAVLSRGFEPAAADVHGPTGAPVRATLAVGGLEGRRVAVVEMADACGLGRLPGGVPSPLTASSRGLGEAMSVALDLHPDVLVVGVGGSASTDGGAGMLTALGARVLDAAGTPLPPGGGALGRAARVDTSTLDPRLASVELVLAADVDSPLTGPAGAARVFGPQKGASAADVEILDAALCRWAGVLAPGSAGLPGAGAAGGVGFALLAALGATRRSGVDVVLDLVGLDGALVGADLVVTGEGSLDEQTLAGKAVSGVARRALAHGVPVVAVCGTDRLPTGGAGRLGLAGTYPLGSLQPDVTASIAHAPQLLREMGSRIARERLDR